MSRFRRLPPPFPFVPPAFVSWVDPLALTMRCAVGLVSTGPASEASIVILDPAGVSFEDDDLKFCCGEGWCSFETSDPFVHVLHKLAPCPYCSVEFKCHNALVQHLPCKYRYDDSDVFGDVREVLL